MYTSARTPELSEILQSLYISDIFSASDEEVLDTTGITHVVSVCQNIPWLGPPPGSSYRVLNINVDDSLDADLLAHFDASNAFIHEALAGKQRGKVLCHCLAVSPVFDCATFNRSQYVRLLTTK
jgi:Dual specificity phosphatase, catalytic domain